MKLTTQSSPVEVQGGSNNGSFSIAMNGKAFRVLSDTLYQNKIGSIVREISCNAYDAHVDAGKADQEFIIHLPDNFEPWFSVRDFGKGLSASDIKNVFTVYFQSTKENSNDSIGAFGLGAKTPFSYTDQFTVTSYQSGICTIYSAFITESGVPNIIEMYNSPSEEPLGVEIKLSVKSQDYAKFKTEVQDQLKFFVVKPKIENGECTYQKQTGVVILKTQDAAVLDLGNSFYKKVPYIVQGNVGYPLDISQLHDKLPEAYEFLKSTEGAYTELYFNIGQIGVTASREGIEYNTNTLASLDSKIKVVRDQVNAYIQSQLLSKNTEWDRVVYINSSAILNKLSNKATLVKAEKYGHDWYFNLETLTQPKTAGINLKKGQVYTIERGMKVKKRSGGKIRPSIATEILVILRDKTHKSATKIQYMFSINPKLSTVYEIEMFDKQYSVEDVKTALGGFENVVLMSSIVLPSTASGERSKGTVVSYYEYTEGSYIRDWDKAYGSLKELTDPVVYVVINSVNLVDTCDKGLINQYEQLLKFDDNVLDLIAVRDASIKRLPEGSISLQHYTVQKFKEHKSEEDLFRYKKHMLYSAVKSQFNSWKSKAEILIKDAPKNELSRFLKFAYSTKEHSVYNEAKITAEFMAKIRFLGYDSYLTSNSPERRVKLESMYNKVITKYPLLKLSPWDISRTIPDSHLCEYLKQMQKVL